MCSTSGTSPGSQCSAACLHMGSCAGMCTGMCIDTRIDIVPTHPTVPNMTDSGSNSGSDGDSYSNTHKVVTKAETTYSAG